MQKLFENWRGYISEALLLESRKSDAKNAIIKNLDQIDWVEQEPGYPDFAQGFLESLQAWVDGLNSSKHLVDFARLVNLYIFHTLVGEKQVYGGSQWNRFRPTLEKAQEAYEVYNRATDRKLKVRPGDFFDFEGLRDLDDWPYPEQRYLRNMIAEEFPHLRPLAAGHRGDNNKGPIEPISLFLVDRVYEYNLSAMDVFIYFSFHLKEILRQREYKDRPDVKKAAGDTTDIIVDNEYYTISHIHSMQAGCVAGCSTWCISQVPSKEQEDDPALDDARANRFNFYVKRGDKIYILDFKYLKKNTYQKVSMQYNIKRKTQGPWEVIDCGGNMNDIQRRESAIEKGVKFNLVSVTGLKYRPNKSALLFDFEEFLEDSVKKVSTYGYYEKRKYFTPIAEKLGIALSGYSVSPLEQWETITNNQIKAIENLTTEAWRKLKHDPHEEVITMLFDCQEDSEGYPCTGIWRSVPGSVRRATSRIEVGRKRFKELLKSNPDDYEAIRERLFQEAGGPNYGAARNLTWRLIRRVSDKEVKEHGSMEEHGLRATGVGVVGRGTMEDIEKFRWTIVRKKVMLTHWEWHILLGTRRVDGRWSAPPDPAYWFERHADDLAEEIVNVLIDINPATLLGHFGLGTDISKWLADDNNRDLLAGEIRRIFEENMDTAIKLAESLALQNPEMVVKKTWKLFYKTLGKEVGHLIDKFLGSDDDRALEIARDLQENKKRTSGILISIRR